MKKNIFIIILFFTIIGCAHKEVKIPLLPTKGLQELHDHSSIWFFFKQKGKDTIADINRNNTIATTHWIYHIDRRLSLKHLTTSIHKLKEKHATSIHAKKGMHNYFSYSDTISNKLSFFVFDSIYFSTDNSLLKKDTTYRYIELSFHKNLIKIENQKVTTSEWKNTLASILKNTTKKPKLLLSFSENILFQDYLLYRAIIRQFENSSIKCDKNEYIFSSKN